LTLKKAVQVCIDIRGDVRPIALVRKVAQVLVGERRRGTSQGSIGIIERDRTSKKELDGGWKVDFVYVESELGGVFLGEENILRRR